MSRMREVDTEVFPVAGKKAADESDALKRIAIAAARAGALEPRAADRIGRRVLRQVLSSEPLTARHAMALAVEVARKVKPRSTPDAEGDLTVCIQTWRFNLCSIGEHGCHAISSAVSMKPLVAGSYRKGM